MVTDAPATKISVIFSNGAVADSVSYGFNADDLDDDMNASATYIDGFAGHLCDWHRVKSTIQDVVPLGRIRQLALRHVANPAGD